MAARENRRQNLFDDLRLPDDHTAELIEKQRARLTELGQVLADAVGGHLCFL